MKNTNYYLVQGNYQYLGSAIRKYDELKHCKLVCCCNQKEYLEIKNDPDIKKNKVSFCIDEHSHGLRKQLFSKGFFNIFWAMINRYFASKDYTRCKDIILCYGEQGNVTINYSKIIDDVNSEEMKRILEKNPKMVLRRRGTAVRGIYSDILVYAGPLRFAYENGLDVYFDMKHYENMYRENKSDNSWDYYFEQKSAEPAEREFVLISDLISFPDEYNWKIDPEKYLGLNKEYNHYLSVNSTVKAIIEEEWREYKDRIGNDKVVGVKFRGTDYKPEYVPFGHGIQNTCDEMINNVRRFLSKYNYKYIYLAVEEEETIKKFIDEFGEQYVLYRKGNYIKNYNGEYGASIVARDLYGPKEAGVVYVCQVEGLLKCDSFICNLNCGAIITIARKGNDYEHLEIYNNELTVATDTKISEMRVRNSEYLAKINN